MAAGLFRFMDSPIPPATERPLAFILVRVAVVEAGAFGVLLNAIDGIPFAVTLERTYSSERGPYTKIPQGRFDCGLTRYHRGGYETFEIFVEGHSRLLFHCGNVEAHSEGCVLVGESFELINAAAGIAGSRKGFEEFMAHARRFGSQGFTLQVTGVTGANKPSQTARV
jgi:hypothetical protein